MGKWEEDGRPIDPGELDPRAFDASAEEGDSGVPDEPERRYQPASPGDLARFPPRDGACRGIREMLRDHCDGELSDTERTRVDEHVHECRDCALALSRMELEALRLRQALVEESEEAAAVPADFVRDVMARIGAIVLEDAETPPQFTSRVMERVRREWPQPSLWRRAFGSGRRIGATAAAAALLAVIGALAFGAWFGSAEEDAAGFEVVAAASAEIEGADGAVRSAEAGDGLREGDRLTTGPGGEALVSRLDVLPDPAGRPIPATRGSRLLLDAGGAMRVLPKGRIALLAGTAVFECSERFEVELPGSATVALDAGSAWVTVEDVRRHDAVLAMVPVHRVRIEVVEGRARVLRGTADVTVVGAGQVARFDGWSTVEVEAAPTPELLARSYRAGRSPAVAGVVGPAANGGSESWTGRVVDAATGRGVELASVEIRIGDGSVEKTRTAADGWFRFTSPGAGAAVAIVRVLPPGREDAEWAAFGPEPMPLDVRGASRTRRLPPIALRPDVPVRGVVLNAAQGRVAAATIVPCIVDELFAIVDRVDDLAVQTDGDGAFTLRGLPTDLPRHQMLALVVEKRGLPRHVRLDLGGRRGVVPTGPLQVFVPDPHEVAIAGLRAGEEVRVLREIPGVPLAAMSEEFAATADAGGRAVLRGVGPGALWMIGSGDAKLHRLVAVAGAAAGDHTLVASEEITRSSADLDRLWSQPRQFVDRSAPVAVAATGRRLGAAAPAAPPRASRYVAVQGEERAFAGRTQLFLEGADGSLRFLGEVDGPFSVPFVEPSVRPYRIVAIGANGAVGVLTAEEIDASGGEIAMRDPGVVEIGEGLRGALEGGGLIAFDLLDGPLAGRRFWRLCDVQRGFQVGDLPPGSYSAVLPDGTRWPCTVAAGGRSMLVRDPGAADGDATGGR